MQFYFIRHAQSENNALWARTQSDKGRKADPGLTAVGKEQAALLGNHLAQATSDVESDQRDVANRRGFPFTHLYTSLMIRSIETGTAVSQALDIPLVAWPEIHEHGGIFLKDEETGEHVGCPGNTPAYLQERYPQLQIPDTVPATGWWNRPYETRQETQQRARQFLQALLLRHGDSDGHVAIISHGGFYYAFMMALLGFPDGGQMQVAEPLRVRFHVQNTAITRISFNNSHAAIAYTNRLDHLPANLIT